MRRRSIAAACGAALALLLCGCGAEPSPVEVGPSAPTGLGKGPTLYYLDAQNRLVAERRESGHLGTPAETVSLLLSAPAGDGLHTEIRDTNVTLTEMTVSGGTMTLRLPLGSWELSPRGVDQIACTALASHVQAGGSSDTRVVLDFTDESVGPRGCPVLP